MVAYVIWVWLILQSCCAYWKCNKNFDMKRTTVQWWPQEQWTHNRWATRTLRRPRPSALITVDESHGTRPIKPHYLDRENMREQDHWSVKGGGRRDGYHLLSAGWSSWGVWHFWRSSEVWRWHRFVIRQLLCVHLMSGLAKISAHRPFPKWTSTLTGPDALSLISTTKEKIFNCEMRWSSFQHGAMREALQMKVMLKFYELCIRRRDVAQMPR